MAKKKVKKSATRKRPMWFPLHLDQQDFDSLVGLVQVKRLFRNRSEALMQAVLHGIGHRVDWDGYRRSAAGATQSGLSHPVRMTQEERGLVGRLQKLTGADSLAETLRLAIRCFAKSC